MIEKSGNESKKKQFEDLKAQVGERLNKLSLREHAIEPVDRRPTQNRNRNNQNDTRDENNNNQRYFQRGEGFRRSNDNNQNNNNRYNRSNNPRVSVRTENE